MTSELLFVLVFVLIVVLVVAPVKVGNNQRSVARLVLDRLRIRPTTVRSETAQPKQRASGSETLNLTEEEKSLAELDRLMKLVEDRKQLARNADISHHLWGFYKNLFRNSDRESPDHHGRHGEWYDVKILHVDTASGKNEFEFELKGDRYRFVDDEELAGWRENIKFFSLFLYDESGRCLVEIPMKVLVDKRGRNYSISSGGPKAFLPGDWVADFINVILKHRSIRNQEIRAQKHQERLWEIEDLRDRFGISD